MKPSQLFIFMVALLLISAATRIIQAQEIINEVYLLERQDRLLAFSGLRNNWFEKELRPGETVVKSIYDGNVAVAYTTERALAFSGIIGDTQDDVLDAGQARGTAIETAGDRDDLVGIVRCEVEGAIVIDVPFVGRDRSLRILME